MSCTKPEFKCSLYYVKVKTEKVKGFTRLFLHVEKNEFASAPASFPEGHLSP